MSEFNQDCVCSLQVMKYVPFGNFVNWKLFAERILVIYKVKQRELILLTDTRPRVLNWQDELKGYDIKESKAHNLFDDEMHNNYTTCYSCMVFVCHLFVSECTLSISN